MKKLKSQSKSLQENFDLINTHLTKLDVSDINDSLYRKLTSLLKDSESAEKKNSNNINRLAKKILIFILISSLLYYNFNYIRIYVIYLLRICVLAINPYLNLIDLFEKNCLVKNPLFISRSNVDLEACAKACDLKNRKYFLKEFTNLPTNENEASNALDKKTFDKLVTDLHVPLIDSYSISNWDVSSKNVHNLLQIYLNGGDEIMNEKQMCYFDSNILNSKQQTIHSVLDEIVDWHENNKSRNNVFISWENCNRESSKLIRKLIKRPSYLPDNIEIVMQNWLFIALNNSRANYVEMPVSFRTIVFSQIFGDSKIKLFPIEQCNSKCDKHEFILKKGQILIFSDIWKIKFRPVSRDNNLILALLGHY